MPTFPKLSLLHESRQALRASVYAAVLLTCASCASITGERPFMWVGLHMAGSQPFCVYDVQFVINGGNRNHDRDVSRMCTNNKVGPKGLYLQSSSVEVEFHKNRIRTLEVRYRRTPEGPQMMAEFDLRGKLEPQRGYNAFSIGPSISENGVALVRTDELYDRFIKHSKFVQIVVEFKKDAQ